MRAVSQTLLFALSSAGTFGARSSPGLPGVDRTLFMALHAGVDKTGKNSTFPAEYFKDYSLAKRGETECHPDTLPMDDEEACERFALQLFSLGEYVVKYDPYYPPGCFVDRRTERVQFNTHKAELKGYADWFQLVCYGGFHLAPAGADDCSYGQALDENFEGEIGSEIGTGKSGARTLCRLISDHLKDLAISPIRKATMKDGRCVARSGDTNRLVCHASSASS